MKPSADQVHPVLSCSCRLQPRFRCQGCRLTSAEIRCPGPVAIAQNVAVVVVCVGFTFTFVARYGRAVFLNQTVVSREKEPSHQRRRPAAFFCPHTTQPIQATAKVWLAEFAPLTQIEWRPRSNGSLQLSSAQLLLPYHHVLRAIGGVCINSAE